ncbi:MAG: hypothetical protein SV862_14705 [Pseudomonadota bacterium]|nr:hypothetical protein [Pseudomonadota bacterium]
MARSAEECRRIIEEEDRQPYLPGYTWGEFSRLAPRQKSREWQKLTQRVTSFMGCWKTCDLSACRRARACRGFLTEAQYKAGYHDAFPPCIGPRGERHQEALNNWRPAFGLPPEEDDGPKYDGRPSDRGEEVT